jgi:ubiquinone/menaquinone biosynthesis C-methylase UbiE
MTVLGPGSGKEVEQFATQNPECQLHFLEASKNFQKILLDRFTGSRIVLPHYSGDIALADNSQDVVCAFSVLHHIPNVSKVIAEIGRITKPGGLMMTREPCSSMGDWRGQRSATPNERGISRSLMVKFAEQA